MRGDALPDSLAHVIALSSFCLLSLLPVAALYSSVPDNVVTVQAHPYETATTKSAKAVTLPLSLPFTVSMRTREARVSTCSQALANAAAAQSPDLFPSPFAFRIS